MVARRKPTETKLFHRPCRETPNQPVVQKGQPLMPAYFDAREKAGWIELVESLSQLNLLSSSDGAALEQLVLTMLDLRDARAALKKEGMFVEPTSATGIRRLSPEFSAVSELTKQYRSLMSSFGMTPADRTKISVVPATNNETEDDDIFALMK